MKPNRKQRRRLAAIKRQAQGDGQEIERLLESSRRNQVILVRKSKAKVAGRKGFNRVGI